jgi:hypothetical protein
MRVVLLAAVLVFAAAIVPAHAQNPAPGPAMQAPPAADCSAWKNQQAQLRLKLDATAYGDQREQVKGQLFEVEYHLRTDCFGK